MQKIDNGPRIDVSDLTTTDYYAPDAACVGGHFGCRGQVRQITNALGHVTTYNEYDAHGHVMKTTDPNALVTTFAYSPRGWLTSRSVAGRSTLYQYDNVGQLKRVSLADGSYIDYTYDAAHRLTDIADTALNRIHYTLDAMGNRIQEDVFDASNTLNLSKRRVFDALNRL